jgi:hypothetical protein
MGKDLVGSSHGIIEGTMQAFAWGTEENHEKP